LGGEFAYESRVGVGVCSTKTVVEVEDERDYTESWGKCGKGSQHGDGICAAADGHTDPFAGAD
jgi:hypothetical protein